MNEYMTDKEKELQVINEFLRHDLQVSRINNQSLQEALLETQSLSSMCTCIFKCINVCTCMQLEWHVHVTLYLR
uniref:Uncharacterized protein n=1 Tax=Amphimedon queenslandica TaxID=400682 RepID=A0A1X7T3E8_AMPQE